MLIYLLYAVLALDPLIGAISAGNVVLIKPSEQAPACSSFLANNLPQYLDSNAIKVIEGGSDVCEQLLQQKWDKIFFTGSPRVASIVMSAAAKNLTPVTLELGGKCPAILDSLSNSSDFKVVHICVFYACHIVEVQGLIYFTFRRIFTRQDGSEKNCRSEMGSL